MPVVETLVSQQEEATTDPATPAARVENARLRLTELIDDVKENVTDQDDRDYQTNLLDSALSFVEDEESKNITADNAIAVLEDLQLYLDPLVQGDAADPVAQRHMAAASRILNLLNVSGKPDNTPIRHNNP